VASDLPALTPRFKSDGAARFSTRHFDHEMHPRDHQAVVQEAELHVLATNGGTGKVLFAVAANLFEHLRMDLKVAPLGQEAERLAAVQVVVELAVRPETGEGPASDEATLPQPAQATVGDIFIASDEAYDLRCRTEPIPQNGVENIEVSITNAATAWHCRPLEFGKTGHRKTVIETG
jgi:hypothetical protein